MELEDETPPDFDDNAPTIPEHIDREFRSKVRFEQEVQYEPLDKPPEKVPFEPIEKKVSKISMDVATQARPSIAGFHHETNLCAPQDVANTVMMNKPPAPRGLKVDASVGEGETKQTERSYNGVLDTVLGSVLDRCYLFCYEREWRTWQSAGAVGSKGSRAFSVSQAHSLATMELSEFEDLHLAMVIELDMIPGSISFVGHELSLANPVSINAVRVVYWLQDFVLVCQNIDGRLEHITDVRQTKGVGVGTGSEEQADETSASEKIAFQEYAWLLDDFDDMMVRRRIVGEVPSGSSSLEAARMRRKEMEQQRMSSRHHTSFSARRAGAGTSSARKPLEETNETLRALRQTPTFPQIAKPRRVQASNGDSGDRKSVV